MELKLQDVFPHLVQFINCGTDCTELVIRDSTHSKHPVKNASVIHLQMEEGVTQVRISLISLLHIHLKDSVKHISVSTQNNCKSSIMNKKKNTTKHKIRLQKNNHDHNNNSNSWSTRGMLTEGTETTTSSGVRLQRQTLDEEA